MRSAASSARASPSTREHRPVLAPDALRGQAARSPRRVERAEHVLGGLEAEDDPRLLLRDRRARAAARRHGRHARQVAARRRPRPARARRRPRARGGWPGASIARQDRSPVRLPTVTPAGLRAHERARRAAAAALFVVLELPDEVRAGAARGGASAARGGRGRGAAWVRPEGLHLTLKFLGATLPDQVEAVEQALGATLAGVRAPHLQPSGLGAFHGGRHVAGRRDGSVKRAPSQRARALGSASTATSTRRVSRGARGRGAHAARLRAGAAPVSRRT